MLKLKYPDYVCNTNEEIQKAVEKLDTAKLVELQFNDGGVLKETKKFLGVYNINKGEMCNVVSRNYNLLQHKDYLNAFYNTFNRLNIKYSTRLQQQGNKVIVDIDFIGRNIKYEKLGEEFSTGFRIANSYDKTVGVVLYPKFTRLACTNGMVLTREGKMYSVRHNSKLLNEIDVFVERQINKIINSSTELQTWISNSMGDSVEWNIAVRILEKLIVIPKHREQILKRLNISMIKQNVNNKKTFNYVLEKTVTTQRLTRWEIYNAITHYISHGEQITPQVNMYFQSKAEEVLKTPLIKMPLMEREIVLQNGSN